jgi:hypothetical protein
MDWKFLGVWSLIFIGCFAFWIALAVLVMEVL